MQTSFQVLFWIKLEKLGILIGMQMSYSGFVSYVLNNIKKVNQAGKNL